VGTRDELLHAASIQGEPALRAPHRINRSLRGWQEIPSYRCDTKGASERRATTRRIDVDAARSKLNRGFHGIRHWLAFVGKTSARKLECGGRTRERERGGRGGRRGEGRQRKKLIPWITKNKARVDGKLFSNGLRQGLSLYIVTWRVARSFVEKNFPCTWNYSRK